MLIYGINGQNLSWYSTRTFMKFFFLVRRKTSNYKHLYIDWLILNFIGQGNSFPTFYNDWALVLVSYPKITLISSYSFLKNIFINIGMIKQFLIDIVWFSFCSVVKKCSIIWSLLLKLVSLAFLLKLHSMILFWWLVTQQSLVQLNNKTFINDVLPILKLLKHS